MGDDRTGQLHPLLKMLLKFGKFKMRSKMELESWKPSNTVTWTFDITDKIVKRLPSYPSIS